MSLSESNKNPFKNPLRYISPVKNPFNYRSRGKESNPTNQASILAVCLIQLIQPHKPTGEIHFTLGLIPIKLIQDSQRLIAKYKSSYELYSS